MNFRGSSLDHYRVIVRLLGVIAPPRLVGSPDLLAPDIIRSQAMLVGDPRCGDGTSGF